MKTLKFNQYITEASKTEAIYNDYPAAAKANAKKALKWRDEHGRDEVDGGTEVGWARANQLAKGEKLSRDVVSRMAQFNRHRKNSKISAEYKDEPWKDRGYIAWLIWGGDEGVDWAMKKMDEIEAEETNEAVDIDKVEKYADKVMDPIDVEFTKHFYDQLTRAEHDKEITDAELIGFFKRLAKKKKDFDKFKQDYDQFVAKDNRSQINIPFKNKVDQIIAKTIMRKDDFKTSNAEYKFENKNTNMKHIKLFEQFITEAKFPGRKGDFIKWKGEYFDVKKTAGSTAYVKFPHTAASAFSQVWGDEVTLSDETYKGKKVWLMESTVTERFKGDDLKKPALGYIYNKKETKVQVVKMADRAMWMSYPSLKDATDKEFDGMIGVDLLDRFKDKFDVEEVEIGGIYDVKESVVNERYVTKRDIEGWEKDNGKLPFPPEVLAATKLMAKYKLADDDQLTRAHIWYRFHDGSWIDMEKFGAHVKKFYGSDFYTEFSSGYTSMFMEAKAHAASIMALIEDKNANGEAIEPAYYEVKEWFKNHDLDYKRSRIFNAAVDYVQKWLKESGIKTL